MKKARRSSKQRRSVRKTRARAPRRVQRRVIRKATRVVRRAKATTRPRRAMMRSARKVAPRTVSGMQTKRPQPAVQEQPEGMFIGAVNHYFTKIGVCILDVTDNEVAVGDKIKIVGATTNLTQTVRSIQLDRKPINRATRGQSIGLKVEDHVREKDKVYKIS